MGLHENELATWEGMGRAWARAKASFLRVNGSCLSGKPQMQRKPCRKHKRTMQPTHSPSP